MEKYRIKEAREETEDKIEERDLANFVEDRIEEKTLRKRKMEIDSAIHINLISVAEMKVHTKEMRSENDQKFVECLMVQGLTKQEALKRVDEWNARGGVANYDC